MKKILVALLALSAVFCFASCKNGKCDECGTKGGLLNPVTYNEETGDELCAECLLLGNK